MMMAESTAVSVLAVLAMLFGLFQEGLQKLDAEDYPGAVAAFTKIVEHEQADADLRGRALLWRAAAHGKAGDADRAKADLAKMLGEDGNPDLRAQAFAAFAQLGGDPLALLPKETPQQAFERMKVLGKEQNLAAFRKRLAGDVATALAILEQSAEAEGHAHMAAEWVARLCGGGGLAYGGAEMGEGRDIGTAKVMAVAGKVVLTFELLAVGDEWHFARLLAVTSVENHRGGPGIDVRRNQAGMTSKLKQIALALHMFTADNQNLFPNELKQLVEYVGDESVLEFVDPTTGKAMPLLYRAPGALNTVPNPSERYIVATPVPIDGRRVVAFVDGHVELVAEDVFVKTAREQGWKLRPAVPVEVEPDVAAKVGDLVKRLGDPQPAARRTAYEELKALGDQAVPVLENHRDHPDPEIRLTIRQLLK